MVRSSDRSDGFLSEEALVRAIVEHAKLARPCKYKAFLEVDAGVGIADIVLCSRRPRTTRAIGVLAKIHARLAPLLAPNTAAKVTSRDALERTLGLSRSSAQRVIQQLHQLGILTLRGEGIRLAAVGAEPFPYIVAVEAKLKKWQSALAQAYRNRQFADESWVVLDHRYQAPAAAQLDRFQRSGVGLASVSVSGELFIHQAPIPAPPISTTKRWHAQAALARRVTTT